MVVVEPDPATARCPSLITKSVAGSGAKGSSRPGGYRQSKRGDGVDGGGWKLSRMPSRWEHFLKNFSHTAPSKGPRGRQPPVKLSSSGLAVPVCGEGDRGRDCGRSTVGRLACRLFARGRDCPKE